MLMPALASTFIILLSSCGGKADEEKTEEEIANERYRYDHLDKIINQYGNLLMATPIEGMEMERLLMDINSRCEMLMADGDTLTALYFHHAIEHNVRARDSLRADRIFGRCPYTAFSLEEE